MKIGIDASRAVSTAPTGTEAYSYHLIQALLPELSQHHEVRLYFRDTPKAGVFPGAEIRAMPFPRLWTHARLSWEMLCHPVDVLFVPAHVLPLFHPPRSLVTVHDLGYHYFPEAHPARQRWYLTWSTRWNVSQATHVLADSKATREAILKIHHIPSHKITVAYPGYNANLAPVRDPQLLADVRTHYHIPDAYILFLGRIQPRKNLIRLIKAFALLIPAHPHLSLVLAGPTGWLAAPILACVKALGLEQKVIFPGYIAKEHKAALISGARVFAYPSLYEGFGFPALEAQACDVPLLASRTSSLPEVVGDGGLLVNPLDEHAIASGLKRILEDSKLAQQLRARGRANLKRFSWSRTADTVFNVIEKLSS